MPVATLTTRGQVMLPKTVREHLNVGPGDKIDFVIQENGEVLVQPATYDIRDLKGLLARPGRRAASLEEMEEAVQSGGGTLE